jgi:hypothetical protein
MLELKSQRHWGGVHTFSLLLEEFNDLIYNFYGVTSFLLALTDEIWFASPLGNEIEYFEHFGYNEGAESQECRSFVVVGPCSLHSNIAKESKCESAIWTAGSVALGLALRLQQLDCSRNPCSTAGRSISSPKPDSEFKWFVNARTGTYRNLICSDASVSLTTSTPIHVNQSAKAHQRI